MYTLKKEGLPVRKNITTLYDAVTNDSILSKSIEDFLITEADSESLVTASMVVELLKIIKTRLNIGQKITMEKTGTILTKENYNAYLVEHFSGYICGEVMEN